MLRRSGIAMAAFFLLTSMGWGQDNRYDVSLGGSAVFSKQSTGNGTVLTPTNSGAVLITGRYRFSEHSSVEINYSHTANSQIYFASPLTYRIQSTIGEYSGAYVFSFHQSEKIEPFVFAGAAALVFYPGYNSPTSTACKLYSCLAANQAGLPLWRRTGLADFLHPAPGPQVFTVEPPGSAPAVPRAGLQGTGFQCAEPVYRRPRTYGGAFGGDRGEVLGESGHGFARIHTFTQKTQRRKVRKEFGWMPS